jgi:hypothetical protein
MANGPGKVLADGESQVERYLRDQGLTQEEIEDTLEVAISTDSYVIVGTRPDALFFEFGVYRIEEGGPDMDVVGDGDVG